MKNLTIFAFSLFLLGQSLHAAPIPGTCVGDSCFWSLRDTSGVIHNTAPGDRSSDDPLTFPDLESISQLTAGVLDMTVREGQVLVTGIFTGNDDQNPYFQENNVGFAWNTNIALGTLDEGSLIQLDNDASDSAGHAALGGALRTAGLGGALTVGLNPGTVEARYWNDLQEETGSGPNPGNSGSASLAPVGPGVLVGSVSTHISDEGTHSIGFAGFDDGGNTIVVPYISSFDASGVPQSTTLLHDAGNVPIASNQDVQAGRLRISSLQQDGEVVVAGGLDNGDVFRWEGDPANSVPANYDLASAVLAGSGLPMPAGAISDHEAIGISADGSRTALTTRISLLPNRGLVWEVDEFGQDQMAWLVEDFSIQLTALSDDGRIAAGRDDGSFDFLTIWDLNAALADGDGEFTNSGIDFVALLDDTFGAAWPNDWIPLEISGISYLAELDSYLFALLIARMENGESIVETALIVLGSEILVPEPTTLLLLTTLGGAAAMKRMRGKRSRPAS